ncbi:Methyltransferase type 11 [Haloterrigena turkmenica DSM 5511]|uniref:Methyltransferase type 11 n=1 Tax=Haloterrigena turkmenica (strain ATCC 51198 / DSM 5511 / JCM 9101 / NCIMB 13204 / VKM B-1734 / 4k) TaxID=543526 RepID=D2RTX5_HALTV|nr:methyltransferase domain-containing protein [Haloterrigena turkmenica]ADB61076.1 Methyltransferase type 11 [Haloterrigena turkmenica DSM 5511]
MNDPPESDDRSARHVWSAGRYPAMAPNMLPAIARLVNAAGIDPGNRVLDVGCGTGNAALTARRSGADVVGLDLAHDMLELARENAALAGYDDIGWLTGDAEALPVSDGAFDVVLSNFGHVFAPDSTAAGAELRRATKSGGRVCFTAWSPNGVVGDLTEVLTDHVDESPGDPRSHLRWGDPEFVREEFSDVPDLSFQRRHLEFRYATPHHFWREFAEESGPLSPVLRRMDDDESRDALRRDAVAALEEWFGDNAIRVEYLQVRAVLE